MRYVRRQTLISRGVDHAAHFLDNPILTEYKRRVGQLTEEVANGQE